MAASTWRRSESVRATNRWSAPAPRSKPSRTTYAVSMKTATAYQSSNMSGPGGRHRSVLDLARQEEEEKHAEDEIEAAEPDEREESRPGVHHLAGTLRGPEDSVDEPRLAYQPPPHPPGDPRAVCERAGKHEHP